MADEAAVERAIGDLAKRLNGTDVPNGSIPDRTLLCVLPDFPHAYRAELSGGKLMGIVKAPATDLADVRLTAKSDDLVALIEGRTNIATAFLLGRIRVDATPADLMLLRKLF